jgi:ribosomal protein L30E
MIKAKMLQIQSKSMVTVAACFSTTFDIRNTFLIVKVEINNHRLNKVKISNLKTTKDLGVIIKDKFRIGIISILDL